MLFRSLPQSTGPKPEWSEPVRGFNSSSQSIQTPSIGKEKFGTSPITTPSLARPIQPQVRPSPTGAQISNSSSPSPAFLKTPPPKEPTPSISRLKGRGFVQSVVQKSDESKSTISGNTADTAGKKKPSVLDRWPPASSSPSASTSAPVSLDTRSGSEKSSTGIRPTPAAKPVQPANAKLLQQKTNVPPNPPANSSKPSTQPLSSSSPGSSTLGSSNTLISYIKPNKTGDQALATEEASLPMEVTTEFSGVDELGMRPKIAAKPFGQFEAGNGLSKANIPYGKPLTHVRPLR